MGSSAQPTRSRRRPWQWRWGEGGGPCIEDVTGIRLVTPETCGWKPNHLKLFALAMCTRSRGGGKEARRDAVHGIQCPIHPSRFLAVGDLLGHSAPFYEALVWQARVVAFSGGQCCDIVQRIQLLVCINNGQSEFLRVYACHPAQASTSVQQKG